jgi:KamA family protein
MLTPAASARYRAIGPAVFERRPEAQRLSRADRKAIQVVSRVLPFRVNHHLLQNLIDWESAPDDPVFRLVFPHREMLEPEDFDRLWDLQSRDAPRAVVASLVGEIRRRLNPHPSGQREHNVPVAGSARLPGVQHKYRETVLYFPARGQTCHAYCAFCFRWAQFVGDSELKFASKEIDRLIAYLKADRDVSDILLTGGDPMIMTTGRLAAVIEPLLTAELEHVGIIRIGTKSLSFWPQRFVGDLDADELLRLLERITRRGRHVAIMAHINHPREIDNPIARAAIRRLCDAGATVRSQAPLLARVNDDPDVWAENWRLQVRLGIQPYYVFVERDTGPRRFFGVPLRRCWEICREAAKRVSGLGRTARGPVMSATPGKVEILGVIPQGNKDLLLLQFLQARSPDRVRRPFLAEADPSATWYDELRLLGDDMPAFEAVRSR